MTGVFTINYPATMAVIDRMTKLVEKLKRINERYESEISTLSRCRGTTENPHNHDSQIAAYRKIISNNSKDIVDLGLLISQIFSLMVNTQMTDFYLTQLIKNMMPGDSNAPNPETSVIGESLSEQAAKKAGVRVDSRGVPIINNGTDAQAYIDALNELMNAKTKTIMGTYNEEFVPRDIVITVSQGNYRRPNGEIDSQGEIIISAKDQEYIYNLAQKMDMDYPFLLGIWCSESGGKTHLNSNGGTMGLTNSDIKTIINNGSNAGYTNNFKPALDKVVSETYKETFGYEGSAKDLTWNAIYYDAAVSTLILTNTSYHWKAGGSVDNKTAWDAYDMYTYGYHRATEYAEDIRDNMGWKKIDYQAEMSNSYPKTKLEVTYP